MELQTQPTMCSFQLTFISTMFLVSLAGSERERSSVEPVVGKICYSVGLVGSNVFMMAV